MFKYSNQASMEECPYWEANSRPATKIPGI
jgi:hypothetical protein